MLCERCHNAEATVHMTQIINGEKTEEHLCANCADHSGHNWYNGWSQMADFGLQNFFSFYTPKTEEYNPICPLCKTSYQDFITTGKLGCSECYNTFSERLKPTIQKIHGSIHHLGKGPDVLEDKPKTEAKKLKKSKAETQKEKLQAELAKLIEEERFEEAAVIRDKIKALETKDSGVK